MLSYSCGGIDFVFLQNFKDVKKMKEKDLRKLKRIELYEIMLAQSEEIDELRKQLEEAQTALASRDIQIKEAGSIAQASLKLTQVFEEAQKAADLYVYNIKKMAGEDHD